MAQYRLLRNNKESGPYTKEQLVAMGLKPYDLIWADGKSAAWRYPSEVPELKAYAPEVEEQPFDRFYKKKEPKAVIEAVETITTAKKEKPRFRVKADSRKIEPVTTTIIAEPKPVAEPKVTEVVRVKVQETTATPDWKDVYADWQSKTPASPAAKQQPVGDLDEEPAVETKFSQSLSSIKERYVEAVLKPKEQAKATAFNFDKRYIAAAIAIPILCLGMWFGYKYSTPANKQEVAEVQPQSILDQQQTQAGQKPSEETAAEPVDEAPANNAATSGVDENTSVVHTPTTDRNATVPAIKQASANEKIVSEPKKDIVTTTLDTKKTTEKATAEKTVATTAAGRATTGSTNADNVFASVPANKTATRTTSKNAAPGATQPAATAAPRTASKRIEDYVVVTKADKNKGSVENMHLSVSNVTDFPIDLAVVDVEYFDANGKYQKGETVYVKNIPANNAVQVKVPDSKSSYSFNYKVSLISAEEKTLYLIAD